MLNKMRVDLWGPSILSVTKSEKIFIWGTYKNNKKIQLEQLRHYRELVKNLILDNINKKNQNIQAQTEYLRYRLSNIFY